MQVDERKQGSSLLGDAPPNDADVVALEAALLRDGRWEDLIRLHERMDPGTAPDRLLALLEREVSAAADPGRAADALVVQGRLLVERVGRLDRAMLAFERALRLVPAHPEALARSRQTLLALGRVQEALDAADALAGTGAAPPEVVAAFLEVARAAAGRPAFHPIARAAAARVRELDPAAAADVLAGLEVSAAGFREEIRSLGKRADEERDARDAARLHLRIAELHHAYDGHATGPAKVYEHIEEAFRLWPGMPEALDFLEHRAAAAGEPRGLAADLERFAGATADPRGRQEILLRLARVHLNLRHDPAASLATLERAFPLEPARAEAALGLVEALGGAGRFADAARVLERHLDAVRDAGADAELRLRLASLFADHLDDPSRARAEVERVLAAVPGHSRAEQLLERILEKSPDPGALASLLERRAARAESAAARASLLERAAAGLPDDRGADKLRLLGEALAAAPERTDLLAALDRAAAATGLLEPFAEVLRGAASRIPGPAAAPLLRRAAQVLSGDLGRHGEAAALWRQVATLLPGDEEAQAELEACLTLSGDFEALAERLRAALATARDPDERKLLLGRLARHYETAARDPAAAADVYRELLAVDPGDPAILGKLAATLGALERWDEQLATLRELADRPGPAGLGARARCAALLAEKLDRPDEAAELYLDLLARDPELPGVVAALERLLAAGVAARRIAAALAPRYAAAEDWDRYRQMLDLELAGTRDPAERRRLLLAAAAVEEEYRDDPRAAFDLATRAFAGDPSAEGLPALLERLAAAAGTARELADLYRRAWDDAAPEVARELATRTAALAEGPLADPALAAAAWERRLALDPADDRALAALADRAAEEGRWDDAAALLARRIARARGSERAELEGRRADLLGKAGRAAEAAAGYRAALAAGAPESRVLPRLAEVLEAAGADDELGPVLDRLEALAREAGDLDRAVALALKSAARAARRGERAEALARYAAVLAHRPDPEAVAALEGLLDDPVLGPEAARALVPVFEAGNEPRRLAAALEAEVRGAADPERRAELLSRISRLRAADLGDPRGAYEALAAAVRLVPADAALRSDLLEAARDAGAVDEARQLLAELAEGLAVAAPEAAVAVLRELAFLAEHVADEPAGAARHHQRILDLVPGDEDALRNLRRLRRSLGEWGSYRESCLALAAAVADPDERAALLREAATVAEEHLGDPIRALDDWGRLLEVAPRDDDAWAARDRLAGMLGRVEERARAVAARRQLILAAGRPKGAAADRFRELTHRLAVLTRDDLRDPAGAVALFAELLAADPGDAGAREALAPLAREAGPLAAAAFAALDGAFEARGEHGPRMELREARLEVADAAEREARLEEIRLLQEVELGRPDLAFVTACRAFVAGGDREREEPHLARLARETGALEDLALVYEQTAGQLEGEAAASLLKKAARLREVDLRDVDGALRLWRAALAAVPSDREALEVLGRLYEERRQGAELAEVYRRNADLAQGPERIDWLLRLGRLAAGVLGDEERAVGAYREALALDPDHRPALEALDGILWKDRRERHGEVVELLSRLASLAPEGSPERQRYLLRLAQEHEDHASGLVDPGLRKAALADALAAAGEALGHGDAAPAVAHLERLLGRDEARTGAARLLEPVYRARGDRARLADLLDLLLLAPGGGPERREHLWERMTLREVLGDRRAAFSGAIALFREAPDDAAARAELVRLAEAIGGHEELFGVLEDELEARSAGDPVVPDLLRLLAPLAAGPVGRPAVAAEAWERLWTLTEEPEILDELEDLYRREGRLAELVTIFRRRIRLAPDPAAKRELGTLMANLLERLGDKDGAIDAIREVLAVDEGDENALATLSRLLGETARWPELASLLDRQIVLARESGLDNEARELTYKLGRVRQVHLGDPEGALARYRELLAAEPRHGRALAAIEELARADDTTARALAASVLAPIYEAERDWPRLVQALEAMAAAAAPGPARAVPLRRIAELYSGPLGSPEMALVAAGRALREDPDDAATLARAVAAAEAGDLAEELCELLLAAADRAATDEGRLALLREAARRLDAAGEATAARDAWKRVRILAPDDDEALLALSRLYRDAGEVEAHLEVLRTRLLREEDPARRRELLLDLADAQERAGDVAGALTSCRRVLEWDDRDGGALARMDRLCTAAERWGDLAQVLGWEAEAAAGPADRIPFQLRLAALLEGRLLDREGALVLYREILAAVPGQPEAVARLEAVLARDPACREAASLLEEAYLATGDWAKYAGALDERAAATADPVARKAALLALAGVREERQGRADLAFIALTRAFREDPADETVRESLERVARDTGALEELAALYEEELPRIRAGAVAAVVALRRGVLAEGSEGPEAARPWYERARDLDPGVGAGALPALDRIHRAAERWPELADVLEARAALEEDPEERVAVLFRLAAVAEERLGDRDRAAGAYERIVELEPRHLPSLRALERLYEEAGRHDRLHDVLLAQREASGDPATRDRLSLRLAEVAAKGLGEPERAIEHLRQLLAGSPRNEAALSALEALYEETGRFRELAALLETHLSATVDPRTIARLHEKRGWVLATQLGSGDEALRSYQAVLERDPRNRKTLEAVRDLQREKGDLEGLAATLRRLVPLQDDALGVKRARLELARSLADLGRREEAIDNARRTLDLEPYDDGLLAGAEELLLSLAAFSDAVRAMELRAARLAEAGRKDDAAELWDRIARLWEERLGRKEGAAQALERLLELRPGDAEAFERLRGLYRVLADWRRTAIATERFAAAVELPEERLALLVELAKIHEERLGQKEVALAKLGAALELDPGNEEIRRGLRRLADDTGGHEELAALLEYAAEAQPRNELAASLYLDLGRLQDEVLDDPEAAEASFRKVLEFDPLNADTLDALVHLFDHRGRDRAYVLALEQKLEAVVTLEEKKAILHAIARAYEERLGDVGEAVYSLERALEFDGGDRTTVALLGELYRREGRYADLRELWARARDLSTDPAERLDRQLAIAALAEGELADVEGAVAAYRLALEIDPGCEAALDALERLYTRLDRPDDLLRVLERRMELCADGGERARLLLRAATIREEARNDLAGAVACYEEVLRIDPENLPAVKGLDRLLGRTGDVERQIAALERHLALVERDPSSRAEAVELHVRIAELFLDLERSDRAETWFTRALELDPDCRPALAGLARLHERAGNWTLALEHLRREARLAGGAAEAVDLLYRAGQLEEERLGDAEAARRSYARALEIDPGHLPSLRALRGLLERAGDLDGYLEALVQEANHTTDPAEKTRLWNEVGRFQLETRGDREAAVRAFEEARRQSPDDLAAARGLADLYVAAEDWERAEGCLDVVCRALAGVAGEEAEKELLQRSYRLGFIAERAGNREKALPCFRKAFEIDPTFLPAAEGLARLLVDAGSLEEARNVYQGILLHHREDLSDPEVVELHYAIGELRRKLGDPEAAKKSLRSALELDPYHPEALKALVALTEADGRYDAAYEHRRRLLEVVDGDERRRLLLETAAIARDRLADPYQAIDCLVAALALDGSDAAALADLAALYRETRQAPRLAETLERLATVPGLPTEEAVKARLELAGLYRGELRDEPGAAGQVAAHLEAALDLDWRQAGAFELLEATLGAARDWTGLEAAYVRMLGRIPKEEGTLPARVLLFRTLGDLYLRALKNPNAALEAYRVVTLLAPDDAAGARAYADLLGKKPGAEAEAIVAHRAAIRVAEDPTRSVKALLRLHAKRKEYDRALVAAQVSTHLLGQGGTDEAGILARLQNFAKTSATQSLDEARWALLSHPAVRTPVAEILGLLQEHVGTLFAVEPAKLEVAGKPVTLDPKKRIDPAKSELFFAGAYAHVARVLGVPPPPLYPVAAAQGIHVVGTYPVAIVAGEELFGAALKKKELYFLLAKRLAFARPALTMAALHRAESLEFLVQAAAAMGEPGYRPPGDGKEVDRLRRRLEKALPAEARKAVAEAGSRWLRDPAKPDVRSYVEGAELTATRAAALLAADLEVAARGLAADPGTATRLPVEVRKRDLVSFCLGEEFFLLRKALRLSVEIPS